MKLGWTRSLLIWVRGVARVALFVALPLALGCADRSSTATQPRPGMGNAGMINDGGAGSGGSDNLRLNLGGMGGQWSDAGTADLTTCEGALAAKSTVACDYYALHPLSFASGEPKSTDLLAGSCYVAYLANTSPSAVAIHVEYQGQPLDVAQFARIPSGTGASIRYAPLPDGQLASQQVAIMQRRRVSAFYSMRTTAGASSPIIARKRVASF